MATLSLSNIRHTAEVESYRFEILHWIRASGGSVTNAQDGIISTLWRQKGNVVGADIIEAATYVYDLAAQGLIGLHSSARGSDRQTVCTQIYTNHEMQPLGAIEIRDLFNAEIMTIARSASPPAPPSPAPPPPAIPTPIKPDPKLLASLEESRQAVVVLNERLSSIEIERDKYKSSSAEHWRHLQVVRRDLEEANGELRSVKPTITQQHKTIEDMKRRHDADIQRATKAATKAADAKLVTTNKKLVKTIDERDRYAVRIENDTLKHNAVKDVMDAYTGSLMAVSIPLVLASIHCKQGSLPKWTLSRAEFKERKSDLILIGCTANFADMAVVMEELKPYVVTGPDMVEEDIRDEILGWLAKVWKAMDRHIQHKGRVTTRG